MWRLAPNFHPSSETVSYGEVGKKLSIFLKKYLFDPKTRTYLLLTKIFIKKIYINILQNFCNLILHANLTKRIGSIYLTQMKCYFSFQQSIFLMFLVDKMFSDIALNRQWNWYSWAKFTLKCFYFFAKETANGDFTTTTFSNDV